MLDHTFHWLPGKTFYSLVRNYSPYSAHILTLYYNLFWSLQNLLIKRFHFNSLKDYKTYLEQKDRIMKLNKRQQIIEQSNKLNVRNNRKQFTK